MNKRTAVLLGAVLFALVGVIGLTVYLIQSQQDVRGRAQVPQVSATPTPISFVAQQSCPVPAQVPNVKVEFPNCIGDICNFTQANCSWGSVSGATSYKLKVTQVETNTVVKNEQVQAAVTKVEFPIVQNNTYKCDVSAINSCGAEGASGTHSLLCKVDAILDTPTPAPSSPTPLPKNDCGFSCTSSADCKAGLVCAIGASGQGYCAQNAFEAACKNAPSISSCCSAAPSNTPVQKPTIPPPGDLNSSLVFGATSILILILGVVLFVL